MTRLVNAAIAALRSNRMNLHDRRRRPLALEALDDRVVPTVSAIASTFNGTPIAADSTVWFSAVMKVTGLDTTTTTTVHVDGGTITSPNFTVAVPDADITFTPLAVQAGTTFDAATNTWQTTVPTSGLSGNVFLAGAELPLPSGLPGGVKPVAWEANFTADAPGLKVSWQWAAAAYKQFNTDLSALGVKPVDDPKGSVYLNSHHAGTPENYAQFVVGGARGGGGSNFTGSYSATKSVTPENTPPPPPGVASLSGTVYFDDNGNGIHDTGEAGIFDVMLQLSGFDTQGNPFSLTTQTDADGNYSFANLPAGTYQIFEVQPPALDDGAETVGTVGGVPHGELLANDLIGNIVVAGGENGIGYDFGELVTEPPH
jgi:SdrD B-like domain